MDAVVGSIVFAFVRYFRAGALFTGITTNVFYVIILYRFYSHV